MSTYISLAFDDAQVLATLTAASDDELDLLDFGVIGFDVEGVVRAYNAYDVGADRKLTHL